MLLTRSDAHKAIVQSVGHRWLWFLNPNIYLADRGFEEVSPKQMREDMVDYEPSRDYLADIQDCDDQTFEALGHLTRKVRKARGFAWNKEHAFVVFLWQKELWVYDLGFMAPYREVKSTKRYRIGGIFKKDLIVI